MAENQVDARKISLEKDESIPEQYYTPAACFSPVFAIYNL